MRARSLLVAALLAAAPATAQDIGRAIELPAHRSLMQTRTESALAPFTTDGCSGGLSAGWTLVAGTFPDFAAAQGDVPPWEACCIIHDRAYHDAGAAENAEDSYEARLQADDDLRACVRETGESHLDELSTRYDTTPETVRRAYGTIADAMHMAVRFGGGPCSGLPWRWGYGYPQCTPFDLALPARE
ncbi:hypothetical protein [Ruegeria marina]|uniref:Phospholipase A2 n=1 Tax=Ruegeria marina TaxID=639004 RepID=A0A1G6NPK1_9RHOB|nr:hypothetical protein [Ruegeria marina]SDC69207.1 hypothetical protein SAMN04488239_103171 [Ruegeria marina]